MRVRAVVKVRSSLPRARLDPTILGLVAACCFAVGATAQAVNQPERRILLIGGPDSHGPGEHAYHQGLAVLARLLADAPALRRLRPAVSTEVWSDAWPDDTAIAQASTIVLYFDGNIQHPLLDPARRVAIARAVEKGVGLVVLHQAFTLPAHDRTIPLNAWIGGARYGMVNRTTQRVTLYPARARHPVLRGICPITFRDEFYPSIALERRSPGFIPLLHGELAPQTGETKWIDTIPRDAIVAWGWERVGGGRSVAYSGGHYLVSWDVPQVRTFFLNAVFWTAHLDVPPGGVTTATPADAARQMLARESATPSS